MTILPESGPSLLSQVVFLVSSIAFCCLVWFSLCEKKEERRR